MMTFKEIMASEHYEEKAKATTWVFGQSIDFLVEMGLLSEFIERIKSKDADMYDLGAVDAALKTTKYMKEKEVDDHD